MGRPQKQDHSDTWPVNALFTRVKSKKGLFIWFTRQTSPGRDTTLRTSPPQKPFLSPANPVAHFLAPEFSKAGIQYLCSEHTRARVRFSGNVLLLFAKPRPELAREQVGINPSPTYTLDSDGPAGRQGSLGHAPIPARSAHRCRGDEMLNWCSETDGDRGACGKPAQPLPFPRPRGLRAAAITLVRRKPALEPGDRGEGRLGPQQLSSLRPRAVSGPSGPRPGPLCSFPREEGLRVRRPLCLPESGSAQGRLPPRPFWNHRPPQRTARPGENCQHPSRCFRARQAPNPPSTTEAPRETGTEVTSQQGGWL